MAEQYSSGCYTMTCGPGFLTRYGPYLAKPVGRVHYAATETASEWSGYMNGAVQAGERAAREILADLGKISARQIYQPEPVSVDVPPFEWPEPSFIEKYAPSAKRFLGGLKCTTHVTFLGVVVGILLSRGARSAIQDLLKWN